MYILIFIASVIFMELFSWTIHKYIMHGILWKIHKSHHVHKNGFFELNDLFTFSFAVIALMLMAVGIESSPDFFWIGAGITFYGLLYFFIHDSIIHRRIILPINIKSKYLSAIIRAHKMHHKHLSKNNGESFGLLWISKKYFN